MKSDSISRVPSTALVVAAITKVTFLEVIRDKILYNALVCAILLLGLGILASRLSLGRPERVILDLGLSALRISSAGIAIFVGASVLIREFDRRTIYLALCRPLTRFQFVMGKFCGVALVLVVNWALLVAVFAGELGLFADGLSPLLTCAGLSAIGLCLLQSLVIASLSLCISSFSTASIAVVVSLGFYVLGHNVTQMRLLIRHLDPGLWQSALDALSPLIPNLEHFDLGFAVTYGLPIAGTELGFRVLYGLLLTVIFLGLGGKLIGYRQT